MSDLKNQGFSDEAMLNKNNAGTENPNNKKSKNKIKAVVLSFLVVSVITGIAAFGFAGNYIDKHRGHGPMGILIGRIADDLDLSDQQKSEVTKIKDEIKAKMDANKQSRNDKAMEFDKMFRQDTFDKQKALELAKERKAHMEEMSTFMIDEMAKFHAILTPDQRNKAADLLKEKREKSGKFRDGFKDGKRNGRKERRND